MTKNNEKEEVKEVVKTDKPDYKVKAVGLDTTALNYPPSVEPDEYKYIHVNYGSNNDEFTKDLIRNSKVFMTIDFLRDIAKSLESYFKHNSINHLDGLLVDSNCDFEMFKEDIKEIIKEGFITESTFGISKPTSVEQLVKLNKIIKFGYISLDICPLCFNAEIIKWANENNKTIIGFNPFGGHISSASIIDSFTVPYLLGVIATYADYVFLSSRDMVYAANDKYYLESLIGCKSEKLYLFTKSLNKLSPPLKRAIKNYLIVDEKTVIEVEDPTFGWDKSELVITIMNGNVEEIPEPNLIPSEEIDLDTISMEDLINNLYIDYFKSGKPEGISDECFLANMKYWIMDQLYLVNNRRYAKFNGNCEVSEHKICKNAVVINVFIDYIERTGIFTVDRRAEELNFLLYYRDGKFLFRKIITK